MKVFSLITAILFVLVYAFGSISPTERFNLWVAGFAIPIVLALNLFFLLICAVLRKRWAVLFFLAALLAGARYIYSTVGLKSLFKRAPEENINTFTVVNYNLGGLKSAYVSRDSSAEADPDGVALLDWMLSNGADVQCYQEFPYHPRAQVLDILEAFKDAGYNYYYSSTDKQWDGSQFGILITSRYPILSRGDILISDNKFNRIAYADILVGSDTVRIVNVHLQSMEMKRFHPGYSGSFEDQRRNINTVFDKLKTGVFERSKQIRHLDGFVRMSEYPVVCAGDFNEVPYTFAYQFLKRNLKNAFEEAGSGFGFTYNGNTLDMLRIDHQFYSEALDAIEFETLDSLLYSDHFPLRGRYTVRR